MFSALRSPQRLFLGAILCVFALTATTTSLAAQTTPSEIPEADIADLVGYTLIDDPSVQNDEPWVDPVRLAGLDPDDVEPAPEFDRLDFHKSNVFATGVDQVPTRDDDELDQIVDRHVRVLQTVATLDRDIDRLASQIAELRSDSTRLVERINRETENEARLADEIAVLERAIAELAIRAFIAEDDLDAALTEESTAFGETRIVSDEVRTDQFAQLDERRAELTARQARNTGFQSDLDQVRSALDTLASERLTRLQTRRDIEELAKQTENSYQIALHTRLPNFVEGTNIPLVALNAYVIASRTLKDERPACGITWSMLAGIGHIESFHGHFGDSTLDINGQTTEDIRGPALDGRILQGEEFLNSGSEIPGATSRTEDLQVRQAPEPEPEPEPEAPAPAVEPAPQPGDSGAPEDGNAEPLDGDETDEPAGPAPVIRRLALIEDTDGGRLDGDTTFDRAVGPMQFIPSTWRLFEQDGNLDDELDPQNIYDASLASARYLCASTSTMTTPEGERRAYFAYNHDEQYSQNVQQTGVRFSSQIEVLDLGPIDDEGVLTDGDDVNGESLARSGTRPLGIADLGRESVLGQIQQHLRELEHIDQPGFIW